ncbi:hypothetical protein EOE67_17255 [Rheinheimera riviphila]|uniref:DUF7305 domain-containing protein n=1 Tax=Rheinheimera riviphila TaxID=1834037 RepID=A0A437QFN2_9GAMM|nr:PilX N-terminal domain-containing pilus assembly protein [Rheinheimera riviphila]RVU33343.1 hypothetical protein EOE67_17255 [Rheinheimera riviphila]
MRHQLHFAARQQQGMSLLFVLMLTTIASLLVFTALNSSVSQERMSGNFQKKLNAELLADKAVFESFHQLNAFAKDPANASASDAELAAVAAVTTASASGGRTYQAGAAELNAQGFAVSADGARYDDSAATRKVMFKRISGSGVSLFPFAHAVTGCNAVDLTASGGITSYDSSNPLAADTNVVVRTVTDGGSVTLVGDSPVIGDVLSTGNITLTGSSVISGKLHANGNILLNNASAVIKKQVWAVGTIDVNNTVVVEGEVKANSHINVKNVAKLQGGLRTQGNLTVTNNAKINGAVEVYGDVKLAGYSGSILQPALLRYRGSVNPAGLGQQQTDLSFASVPLLPVDNDDEASESFNPLCDPLRISEAVDAVEQPATLPPLNVRQAWDRKIYTLTTLEGKHTDVANLPASLTPANGLFLKKSQPMYFVSNVNGGSEGKLIINGHITLFIAGDMVFGGDSALQINHGSSLTIITSGRIEFTAGAKVINDQFPVGEPQGIVDGRPVMAIYSSYSGKDGIKLNGGIKSIYAAIYAPRTDIKMDSLAGVFSGSAVGKTVSVGGAGKIRYDQALGKVEAGGSTGSVNPRIVFHGWN